MELPKGPKRSISPTKQSNSFLAQQLREFDLGTSYTKFANTPTKIFDAIRNADVDIVQYYNEHEGNLQGLKIPGVGQGTLDKLRNIIKKGVQKAIQADLNVYIDPIYKTKGKRHDTDGREF